MPEPEDEEVKKAERAIDEEIHRGTYGRMNLPAFLRAEKEQKKALLKRGDAEADLEDSSDEDPETDDEEKPEAKATAASLTARAFLVPNALVRRCAQFFDPKVGSTGPKTPTKKRQPEDDLQDSCDVICFVLF